MTLTRKANAADGEHPVTFRLVNLKNHNYSLEPNGRFSPDDKWLIFRANMLGGVSHVYAVEVKKAAP